MEKWVSGPGSCSRSRVGIPEDPRGLVGFLPAEAASVPIHLTAMSPRRRARSWAPGGGQALAPGPQGKTRPVPRLPLA